MAILSSVTGHSCKSVPTYFLPRFVNNGNQECLLVHEIDQIQKALHELAIVREFLLHTLAQFQKQRLPFPQRWYHRRLKVSKSVIHIPSHQKN